MYKTTHDKTSYLTRTASHSTKPHADLRDCVTTKATDVPANVASLNYGEARFEHDRLKMRRVALERAIQNGTGSRARNVADKISVEFQLGHLRRHIGNLHQVADAASDYQAFSRAVRELYGDQALTAVLVRKTEIQSEMGEILSRPKPSGGRRTPLHERRGSTMEQAIAKAMKDV